MAATDAITSTAVARREVRRSLERLEYHLGRGAKGRLGVQREIRFLDALHRQSVRVAGVAAGRSMRAFPMESFGAKAAAALSTGNRSVIGRMKSSILADFAADSLEPARAWAEFAADGWVWTANASACPTCLSMHGSVGRGPFMPMHPSCLCIPQDIGTPGLHRLTDDQLVQVAREYGNPRYLRAVAEFAAGRLSRAELAGVEAVNARASGRRAVVAHRQKGEVRQLALGPGDSEGA